MGWAGGDNAGVGLAIAGFEAGLAGTGCGDGVAVTGAALAEGLAAGGGPEQPTDRRRQPAAIA